MNEKYWYGIKPIIFRYHGEWSDPEIEYKNKLFNCFDIEDVFWNIYNEQTDKTLDFDKWMFLHGQDVIDYLDELT